MEWLLIVGWCYCHGRWNSHIGWNGLGRCYCLLADVVPQGHYFSLSSMLLIRTSSQMCGRWYLPMFLLRDGLLTLMYIDSLISLERLCSSLPTILKLFNVMLWPDMLQWSWIGEGGLQMFFVYLSKCSSCLTYVLLITFQPLTFISVDNATLFC